MRLTGFPLSKQGSYPSGGRSGLRLVSVILYGLVEWKGDASCALFGSVSLSWPSSCETQTSAAVSLKRFSRLVLICV
jgi:hypothetical protein